MRPKKFISRALKMQGISIDKKDLPYIEDVLSEVQKAEASLESSPDLRAQVPMTVVDKGEILHD